MKSFIQIPLIILALAFVEREAFAQRYPSAASPSVGIINATIPGYGDFMGAKDPSGNLAPLKVDAIGNLLVSGTVFQGSAPWAENLTQLNGSSFSALNYLPARITNGSAYIDPTQIRALTSADAVSAVQSGTWNINVSNQITGFATSALQTTGNGYLSTISTQLPSTLGGKTLANSLSVGIASDQVVPISASALPLPAGAATSALQGTGNTSLGSIDGKLTTTANGLKVDVQASVLPTGGATSALQTTGNTSLSSIDTKTPALVTGRVPVDGSGVTQPVSISGAIPTKDPVNATATYAEIVTLTTTAQTFTAPSNAVGFVLEYPSISTNTDNIRWKLGGTATITSGMRMEPGRDSGYVPAGSTVSVIAETATAQTVTIQWVTQ